MTDGPLANGSRLIAFGGKPVANNAMGIRKLEFADGGAGKRVVPGVNQVFRKRQSGDFAVICEQLDRLGTLARGDQFQHSTPWKFIEKAKEARLRKRQEWGIYDWRALPRETVTDERWCCL
jgi:hypothetical protein